LLLLVLWTLFPAVLLSYIMISFGFFLVLSDNS
jgi:hypothetical protein